MIKSKVRLKHIRGTYCNDETFYDQMEWQKYDIEGLKEDIIKNGVTNSIVIVELKDFYREWDKTDKNYLYAVQDGSHRVRVLKDMCREDKTLEFKEIDVTILNKEEMLNIRNIEDEL